MRLRLLTKGCALAAALALAACGSDPDPDPKNTPDPDPPERTPNILFVIMDDVGVDQMTSMGYGGAEAPAMPTIDSLAEAGLRFRNTWSMPECSPGRSALMTGRYPLRTNTFQALGPNDLANSQTDPWEVTVPKLLAEKGYRSAMFGKFHLAGPEHNEAGNGTPAQLGWEHFHGWTGGLPGSIDTTAGGVAPEGTYSCGFVPGEEEGGAAFGACYQPLPGGGTSCERIEGTNEAGDPAGLRCLTRGGVLVPNEGCEDEAPEALVFDKENAHYVSPLVLNQGGSVEEAGLLDPRGRGFRSTIEVDAAIDWIQSLQGAEQPWMATLSFSSPHTPLQPPPAGLLRSEVASKITADCTNPINQRRITDALIEALDTELARLLIATGIATEGEDGSLIYDPAASDTMVVVVGDNGSFGPTVKLPFDAFRAKGSAYQTGVWVPLIVSGPLVDAPDRDVEHMVNAVDVFGLFADIAEVDPEEATPRKLDAQPLMPYLKDPAQSSVRAFNFTQGALNLQVNDGVNGPCVFNGDLCSHTPTSKSVCEDNGGVWWGEGADDPDVLRSVEHCWQVNQAIYEDAPLTFPLRRIQMAATIYQAVRNDDYKLVRNWALDFDVETDGPKEVETVELYRIDQAVPKPTLDREGDDLLSRPVHGLSEEEQENFDALQAELQRILASQVACPGDGNGDGVVDELDVTEYTRIASDWGLSSTYDFNLDGHTDEADLAIIEDNMGPCP